MITPVFAFVAALITSFGMTPILRRVALYLGVVDYPAPRKLHLSPVPLLGSIAIFTGTLLATVLSIFMDGGVQAEVMAIVACATLLILVGFLDERRVIHPQLKLFVAMPLCAVVLMAVGIRAGITDAFLPGPIGKGVDGAVTLIWVVGITASFNILDHIDGLCAGIAAIASAFLLFLAGLGGHVLEASLAAAVLGAALGFLRWNFNPAKIFMGDGGAMFLGFMVATLGLKLDILDVPRSISWMVPVLILGVPIFDTTLVTISRLRRGLLPFASPGKDHTAHRLANLGLGQRGAVLALYGCGLLFGCVALVVTQLSVMLSYTVIGTMALAGLVALAALELAPYERQ